MSESMTFWTTDPSPELVEKARRTILSELATKETPSIG